MGPLPLLQEEAEALLELQGRLQEAQDTTEALRVQVGPGLRGRDTGALGGGRLRQGLVRAHALSDGWGGAGQLGVQEVQLQGLRGALRQLQQETEQNCRRELQQVHGQLAGEAWGLGLVGWPRDLGFPSQQPAPTRTSGTHGQPASGLWGPPRPGQHLYPELSGFTERGPGPGQDHCSPLLRALYSSLPRPRELPALMEVVGSGTRTAPVTWGVVSLLSRANWVTVNPSQAWLRSLEDTDDVLAHGPPDFWAASGAQ